MEGQTMHDEIQSHHRVSLLKISFVLAMVLALFIGAVSPAWADTVGPPVMVPMSVSPGGYVYVKISNLPTDTVFTVTEGPAGSQGLNGDLITHFNSGPGETQFYLFETHANVRNLSQIDIRIDGGAGMVAYATFANTARMIARSQNMVGIPVTGGTAAAPVNNTIKILEVQKGGVIEVEIFDMPKNVEFTVTMAKAGQKNTAAIVGHVTRTSDLSAVVTHFEIPTDVKLADSLDLHLTAPGYSYFLNFANKDT
jgi:hypothetical protein